MGKKGFEDLLDDLLENDLQVKTVSTGRYPSIRKLVQIDEQYEGIEHQFDPWSITKNMSAAAKSKKGITFQIVRSFMTL